MARVRWKRIAACWLVLFGMQLAIKAGIRIGSTPVGIIALLCAIVVMAAVPAKWVLPGSGGRNILPLDVEEKIINEGQALDKYQILGTHNSTHQCNVFGWAFVKDWQYTHASLPEQLQSGIRNIEIDTWYNQTHQDWQVRHENLLDDLTVSGTPDTLQGTLTQISEWCASRPDHFPLIINLDIKGSYQEGLGWAAPLIGRGLGANHSYTQQAFAKVQVAINKLWPSDRLFTPSQLRARPGVALRDAVREQGWPSVKELKGMTLFFLNLYGEKLDGVVHADGEFFFVRGHDFDNDKEAVYYESNYDRVPNCNCLSRSLSLGTQANLISVNDLSQIDTSVSLRF